MRKKRQGSECAAPFQRGFCPSITPLFCSTDPCASLSLPFPAARDCEGWRGHPICLSSFPSVRPFAKAGSLWVASFLGVVSASPATEGLIRAWVDGHCTEGGQCSSPGY